VRVLDDGALRFLKPDGQAMEVGAPAGHQPPGDAHALPKGAFVNTWRGERMDLALAVDVMIQRSRKHMAAPP
jgi:hypothetical protein